ncbi:MAG: PPOX class F420-dependent oxidoreductase [Streptosporangiales bacterium]|nr:PPOX class F420-dependent oxidoreductase [Streptosporangiales bacterium]
MVFTQTEIDYLESQPLGRLATSRPDGTLQVNPVGFRYNPELGTIDIGGHELTKSHKFRNVADNGRVAFVVDDLASVDPWRPRYVEIRGHGEAIPTDTGTGHMPGPIIRVHPRRIISWGLGEERNARNVA